MNEWRGAVDLPAIDKAYHILPWIPAPKRPASLFELAFVLALSAAFVGLAVWAGDDRQVARFRRLLLSRHYFFRAPFYRVFRTGRDGVSYSTAG